MDFQARRLDPQEEVPDEADLGEISRDASPVYLGRRYRRLGLKHAGWLFPRAADPADPVPPRRADDWFKKAEVLAELWEGVETVTDLTRAEDRPDNYGWHGLRANAASEALDQGHTLAEVNALSEWKPGSTTAAEIYQRVNQEGLTSGLNRQPINRPLR